MTTDLLFEFLIKVFWFEIFFLSFLSNKLIIKFELDADGYLWSGDVRKILLISESFSEEQVDEMMNAIDSDSLVNYDGKYFYFLILKKFRN
jgi:hypothetical protein